MQLSDRRNVTLDPIASPNQNRRILVVDDNESVQSDFRKVLEGERDEDDLHADASAIFGIEPQAPPRAGFEIDYASQGEEAIDCVQISALTGRRYATVFMDVRMPPGCDGIETAAKLWELDPDLQIVICTAFSDYSWDEMIRKLGYSERLLILKKPFDAIEVLQLAHALTEKWSLLQALRENAERLERNVLERTSELNLANAQLQEEIAKHKAAAERVREQAALLEKARDAIVVCDVDDTICFWNNGAQRLYGWTAAEVCGRTLLDLLGGDPGKKLSAWSAMVETGSWTGELSQRTKDGRLVDVECSLTLVRDDMGRPKSILSIKSDVTEKKQAEQQLLRSQRMEGIGALAGGMAHDLNNLLVPIVLGVDILKSQSCNDEDAVILDTMAVSADRAANIVKQVLLFARGEAGERVPILPSQLVDEIEKLVRGTFPKSIDFTRLIQCDALIEGDPTQLQQVLLNLCVNARDAMNGKGRITISIERFQVEFPAAATALGLPIGPYALMKVADAGPGIPPEIMAKIFDPFFTTKEFGKGTGLGLSSAFGIIKNHGGVILADNNPLGGACFQIYLPATDGIPVRKNGRRVADVPRGNGETILLLDDEPDLIEMTSRCLETAGYRVLKTVRAPEAFAMATQPEANVALVITDMMMPVVDGAMAIRALRTVLPDLPIIAMSGGARVENEAKAKAAGASVFLPKPCAASKLLRSIRELLSGRQ